MGTPVFRRLKARQSLVKHMLLTVARFQVVRAIAPAPGKRGPLANFETVRLPNATDAVPATEAIVIQESSISSRDRSKAATVLVNVSQAVSLNLLNGVMRKETAVRLLAAAANELGVDLNPQDELDAREPGSLTESEADRLYRDIQADLSRLQEMTRGNGHGRERETAGASR